MPHDEALQISYIFRYNPYPSVYVKSYIVAACGIMEEEAVPPSASTERPGVTLLKSWLNKNMKVLMSDGRVLVGIFLCTDRWAAAALHSVSCDQVTVPGPGT